MTKTSPSNLSFRESLQSTNVEFVEKFDQVINLLLYFVVGGVDGFDYDYSEFEEINCINLEDTTLNIELMKSIHEEINENFTHYTPDELFDPSKEFFNVVEYLFIDNVISDFDTIIEYAKNIDIEIECYNHAYNNSEIGDDERQELIESVNFLISEINGLLETDFSDFIRMIYNGTLVFDESIYNKVIEEHERRLISRFIAKNLKMA